MTVEAYEDKSMRDGQRGEDQPFQHHALFYRDEREFLAGALPPLRAGIAAGDATFAVMEGREAEVLRDSLGQDARTVQFLDPAPIYKSPARAVAAFTAVARTLGSRPAWVVVAHDWSKFPYVLEWVRYDSVVNLAFAGTDCHGFCCYDIERLPDDVVAMLRRTHPKVHEGGVMLESPHYSDPESFIAEIDRRPLPPSPRTAASMRIQATDLHAVRVFVAEQAGRRGVAADALHNMLVAVTEVATNAVRHGKAPVTVRTWPDGDDGLICEITDSGHWQPEKSISFRPPERAAESGFGLWGVGMLCGMVQVRTGATGTTVRLQTGA